MESHQSFKWMKAVHNLRSTEKQHPSSSSNGRGGPLLQTWKYILANSKTAWPLWSQGRITPSQSWLDLAVNHKMKLHRTSKTPTHKVKALLQFQMPSTIKHLIVRVSKGAPQRKLKQSWCQNTQSKYPTPNGAEMLHAGELHRILVNSNKPWCVVIADFQQQASSFHSTCQWGSKDESISPSPSVSRISISHAQDGGSKPSSLLATGGHCFPSWKSCWLGSHWLWILPCDLSYPSLVKPGLDNDWRGCHLLLSISGNWPWKDKQLAPRTPTTTNSALY